MPRASAVSRVSGADHRYRSLGARTEQLHGLSADAHLLRRTYAQAKVGFLSPFKIRPV